MTTVTLSGGTGLVGGGLVARHSERGDRVLALTRRPERATLPAGAEAVGWDGRGMPTGPLAESSAVVHLAGAPVFSGVTAKRRQIVYESRIESTRSLVETLAKLPAPERPATLVCASAVGIYAPGGERPLDESAELGTGFLAELCRDWEDAARGAEALGLRVVSLRLGIVLSSRGGALTLMQRPFAWGLGAVLGSGEQWVPWIALEDAAHLLETILDDVHYQGPVNAVAPRPVRNRELSRELARVLGRPLFLKAPAFALRAALGELAGELLDSRRVIPARAVARGFRFAKSELRPCLEEELSG